MGRQHESVVKASGGRSTHVVLRKAGAFQSQASPAHWRPSGTSNPDPNFIPGGNLIGGNLPRIPVASDTVGGPAPASQLPYRTQVAAITYSFA